jgi:hypothetical protein
MDMSEFTVKKDLEKLNLETLRKLLVERGKNRAGSKAVLITRLWPLLQTERIIDGPLEEVRSDMEEELSYQCMFRFPVS